MADSTSTVQDLLQQEADARRNATELQALVFAKSQNMAQKAALAEQTGESVNGRFETPESYLVRQQAELEAQRERQRHAATMDFSALSYDIARETAATVRQQMELATKIQEDKSVSLFEDPATAIINAFTLPWDMQELEGTNTKLNLLADAKAKLDAGVQSHAKSTELLQSSLTDAAILKTTAALEASQKIRMIDATNAALESEAQGIERITNMNAHATQAAVQALQLQNAEENMKFARERFKAEQEVRDDRLKQMRENEAALEQGIAFINEGRRRDGLPPVSKEQAKFALMQPKGSKLGEQFGNWLDRGAMAASGIAVADGENAVERRNYRLSVGAMPKNERQASFVQLDNEAVAAAAAKSKDKTVVAQEADKLVEAKLKDWKANIVPGDKSNPFHPPSYEAIESLGLSNMKAYPVVATLLTEANKTAPIDQQQIFDTLLAAVVKRDITGNDAAELMATMYGKLLHIVNVQANPVKYIGSPLQQWNAKVNTGNPLVGDNARFTAARFLPIGNTSGDLTNPVIVQNMIQRGVVSKLGGAINWRGEYPNVPGGGGFYPPLFQSGVVAPQPRK